MSQVAPTMPCESSLSGRVTPGHLRQRLGIEADREAKIFGQGRNFFHIENWYSVHAVIRWMLRLSFLHRRGRKNASRLELRGNAVRLPGLPAAFDGFTFLHLSDLHLDMGPEVAPALIDRVRRLDYDAVVLTGDFRALTFGAIEPALEQLARLRAELRSPVYAVLGNHDSIRMVPPIEAMDIRMLLNEWVPIERGGQQICLAGIDDPHYYRADNLERSCESIPEAAVSVLLSHSPEVYRHAAHVGFDLMLCGHTHGGQICLPGGSPILTNARCPRRFCRGTWSYHQMRGYTSVGSGTSIVDVRFNCPPEVTLHTLRRA